jgi:hypothetical protein
MIVVLAYSYLDKISQRCSWACGGGYGSRDVAAEAAKELLEAQSGG